MHRVGVSFRGMKVHTGGAVAVLDRAPDDVRSPVAVAVLCRDGGVVVVRVVEVDGVLLEAGSLEPVVLVDVVVVVGLPELASAGGVR